MPLLSLASHLSLNYIFLLHFFAMFFSMYLFVIEYHEIEPYPKELHDALHKSELRAHTYVTTPPGDPKFKLLCYIF
jgi:hypothetical protein